MNASPPILTFPALHSTNTTAHIYAQHPFQNGLAISSLVQTKGKGSRGRHWISNLGNLYITFLFTPPNLKNPSELPHFLLVIASLALLRTLQNYSIPSLSIKWPNDILSNGKKIAGILLETSFLSQKPLYSLIGIGLNVVSSPPSLHATHITQHSSPPSLHSLQSQLQSHILSLFHHSDHHELSLSYTQNLYLIHQQVTLNLHNSSHSGIFHGISHDGALILEIANQKRLFYTGDILSSSTLDNPLSYRHSLS